MEVNNMRSDGYSERFSAIAYGKNAKRKVMYGKISVIGYWYPGVEFGHRCGGGYVKELELTNTNFNTQKFDYKMCVNLKLNGTKYNFKISGLVL
jgi:hypothetical protein